MKKYCQAFTLTEILLVSALFAVISLAVFNAFSNGFKLWAHTEHLLVEGDIAIFLDKIDEDLREVVNMNTISFSGSSARLSFPAIIRAATDQNGTRAKEEIGDQIGAVEYTFDPAQKKIFRRQATYGQALKAQWSQPFEVASLIEDITFRYCFVSDRGLVVKSQTDAGVPMGLMIDVQFEMDGQIRHMRRFYPIPVGGGI
ncbi:MAG: prepilin-type N-terminal cleavage/methylation domain-containing protein [Candidatus Omnitrophica bacterium]|nr:prepilin-type N-terminal cleavage/methylation domain-containing protein [Candidatus Omnitrophota bacterium]